MLWERGRAKRGIQGSLIQNGAIPHKQGVSPQGGCKVLNMRLTVSFVLVI